MTGGHLRSMTTLFDRVESFIRNRDLCRPGERVLVACSGGRDSTALLDILRALGPRLGIELGVAHVDHRQRPGSAAPAGLLRRRCRRWGMRFHALALDGERVPPGAGEARMREERFAALERTAIDHGYQRVALGHTRDDQVETVLMRILRGTGTSGLSGIPPRRADLYVRPLLACGGAELGSYLAVRRLRCIEDPSNRDRGLMRNWIRHDILPLLRAKANPAVDQALLRLSRAASRDNDLLDRMTASLPTASRAGQEAWIPLDLLGNLHDAVLVRLLVRMAVDVVGPGANIEQDHLERLLENLRSRPATDWSLDLPGRLQAASDGRVFRMRRSRRQPVLGFRMPVHGPGSYALPDACSRMCFELVSSASVRQGTSSHVFFDGREVTFPLVIRSVAPGDRIRLWGGPGSRKVARLLIDAHIPRRDRPLVPLLVSPERGVLWVGGLRRSNAAPVTAGSDPVLSVQLLASD